MPAVSSDTPAQALTPDMPADAAFRHLARLCEERAKASDLGAEADRRVIWRYGQQTAVQLARWARHLPPSLEGRITASHLCAGLTILCGEREGDTQERQVHRILLTLYLSLLREAAVVPANDLYVAGALWAFLQRMALLSAVSVEEPRSRDAAARAQQAQGAVMRVRENLIVDMAEIVIAGAAMVLAGPRPAAPAEAAAGTEETAPAEG